MSATAGWLGVQDQPLLPASLVHPDQHVGRVDEPLLLRGPDEDGPVEEVGRLARQRMKAIGASTLMRTTVSIPSMTGVSPPSAVLPAARAKTR